MLERFTEFWPDRWPHQLEALLEPTAVPLILGGVALLLFGRRLYWLAVGGLGAAVAVVLASHLASYLQLPTAEVRLLLAVVAAACGAFLAITAQHLVVSAVGFLTGAAIGAWLTQLFWPDAGLWLVATVLASGILGLLAAGRLFDALLVVGTSAAGAWLIVSAVPELMARSVIVLPIITLVGVALQARGPKKGKKSDD